jgi:hypothetical protein
MNIFFVLPFEAQALPIQSGVTINNKLQFILVLDIVFLAGERGERERERGLMWQRIYELSCLCIKICFHDTLPEPKQ